VPDQWIIDWHDYYQILQISPTADPEVINAAHKALAKRYHPDGRNADLEKMKLVNVSHDVLTDPATRDRYDEAHQRESDRIKTELDKFKSDLQQERTACLTLQQKLSDLERELTRARANEIQARAGEQEANRRATEASFVYRPPPTPPFTPAPPPPLPPPVPAVTPGTWRLPISIQTAAGVLPSLVLRLNRNQTVSGREPLTQAGPVGAAAAHFSGNWHYSPQTQILTINLQVQAALQILGFTSGMGIQTFNWSLRVTGGSPRSIEVMDEQGNSGVLQSVKRNWAQASNPRLIFGILIAVLFAMFILLQSIPSLIMGFLLSRE
jgi:curved DNA-binding protein CbpA